jgi:hypothetical protein
VSYAARHSGGSVAAGAGNVTAASTVTISVGGDTFVISWSGTDLQIARTAGSGTLTAIAITYTVI